MSTAAQVIAAGVDVTSEKAIVSIIALAFVAWLVGKGIARLFE